MSALNVYGWTEYRTDDTGEEFLARHLVAARSVAEASRLSGSTPDHIKFHGAKTSRFDEFEKAMSAPGCVFWRPETKTRNDAEWTRVEKPTA